MANPGAQYFREKRAEKSARRKANQRPADLPGDAECKTCANLAGGRSHHCLATQWLLDEPVCDDCANGIGHRTYAMATIQMKNGKTMRRKVAA